MAKEISGSLSVEGINSIIKQLKHYDTSFDDACKRFVERLAEVGMTEARTRLVNVEGYDADKERCSLSFKLDKYGNIMCGYIYLNGSQALFVEFGSGIHYNNGNANPLASEFGYGVGKYPNQHNAFNYSGWWYKGDDDTLHHSLGTKATMPLYSAHTVMLTQYVSIAREVFQNVV